MILSSFRRPFQPFFLLIVFISLIFSGCDDADSSQDSQVQTNPPGTVEPPPTAFTPTNVLTAHNDVQRTGQNVTETTLTAANVNSTSFGKLLTIPMDGRVDAQPLYVAQLKITGSTAHPVVYAVTEHDSVYAFDASTGTIYWHMSLLNSDETPSDDHGCGDITPEVGIMATPVIDLTAGPNGTIYLLSLSKDPDGIYHHRLHALDLTTGAEEFSGPTEITATYAGNGAGSVDGQIAFDPGQYMSRPGLLLLNGIIYTGWGSHCDMTPYTGWLIGYDQKTLQQTSVFNFAPNGGYAALWNAGGGLAADPSTGRIFVSVANGTFDDDLDASHFPSNNDYGNAFVRLNPSGGKITAEDYWTMDNTDAESASDQDLGSGGVLLLPNLTNAAGQVVQLATSAGKDNVLYVFNRQNMGKFNSLENSNIYQNITGALQGGGFSTPAYFNGTVYYGAAGDSVRAFPIANARLPESASSITAETFRWPGVTPVISANGASQGIVWILERTTTAAVLHAYNASNLAVELYNSTQAVSSRDQLGAGAKFAVPTVADGRVIVGTMDGVSVFGLLK
jgi:outer membrane protein assembly factor BamB